LSRVTLLSGGVGGARAARGFAALLAPDELTVVVNVGDDDWMHGVHVSADIDSVVYTLAGVEGPQGWGRAGDTFAVMKALDRLGVDTTFRIGDLDLATCLVRTAALSSGESLSSVTTRIAASLGVDHRVLPATDDRLRTRVRLPDGEWLPFQDYFVIRRHEDEVSAVDYDGAESAKPAPGVVEAVSDADLVVIAPSNPPLSIWPILAVTEIRDAVAAASRVVAVSPLFGGKALKGPADRVMSSLGLPPGTAGVLQAYRGLLDDLIVDLEDIKDAGGAAGVRIHALDTRIAEPGAAARFAAEVLAL
jgi:LPPG:FO 2-phospho-L-lactate transferase